MPPFSFPTPGATGCFAHILFMWEANRGGRMGVGYLCLTLLLSPVFPTPWVWQANLILPSGQVSGLMLSYEYLSVRVLFLSSLVLFSLLAHSKGSQDLHLGLEKQEASLRPGLYPALAQASLSVWAFACFLSK